MVSRRSPAVSPASALPHRDRPQAQRVHGRRRRSDEHVRELARERWRLPDENPPVGLILSARHDAAVAEYAFDGLANKIVSAEYRTVLPDEQRLIDELNKTRLLLEAHRPKAKT